MVRNEPRYLVRALEPSTSDIINGQRLGLLAVDAAMAGYTDCMISQWLTEFAIVPLDLVVLGRKRIPPKGMFWNSVAAKTRQPADLVIPYPRN
jgi:6-phosphofructokinase